MYGVLFSHNALFRHNSLLSILKQQIAPLFISRYLGAPPYFNFDPFGAL